MYKNILIAIDPENPVNVQQAIAVANRLNSEHGKVTLVTVVADIPSYAAEYVPTGQSELQRKAAESKLSQVHSSDNANLATLVISSPVSAGATLVELSIKHHADLIIIASHRPGLKDYFLGSTAGRVVRHATCAVHVLR